MSAPRILGLAGWSGSGKTTLIKKLLPVLVAGGFRVSTVKHAHHRFDLAEPKARDVRLREAGLAEFLFAAPERWALLHEIGSEAEPSLEELLPRLAAVDLILIEGFKKHPHDKIEIHRPANGKPLLAPDDPHIVAIASDGTLNPPRRGGDALPVIDLNDSAAIAAFIVAHCGLARDRAGA